jgi:hypothetical protein
MPALNVLLQRRSSHRSPSRRSRLSPPPDYNRVPWWEVVYSQGTMPW